MSRARQAKRHFETVLMPPAWPEDADAVPVRAAAISGMEAVSPLLGLLPRGGLLAWRAVIVLGRITAGIAATDMEDARTVMRRCMWHLNEDSGNMGWGIAEAMGEIAAQSPPLAEEYGRVILSYARPTGRADNFIDNDFLRPGAYWAIGRFAPSCPEYGTEGAELLLAGLADDDARCPGNAAWGTGKLAMAGALAADRKRQDAQSRQRPISGHDLCDILDGLHRFVEPAASFARKALNQLADAGFV
ncbi:MAG: HEAT repeat domain-containing protein [Deltaproteobacteria bacterium]|nr:HEAT repeat domain-containing protein [Deltaproteobacteria bacterium]